MATEGMTGEGKTQNVTVTVDGLVETFGFEAVQNALADKAEALLTSEKNRLDNVRKFHRSVRPKAGRPSL